METLVILSGVEGSMCRIVILSGVEGSMCRIVILSGVEGSMCRIVILNEVKDLCGLAYITEILRFTRNDVEKSE